MIKYKKRTILFNVKIRGELRRSCIHKHNITAYRLRFGSVEGNFRRFVVIIGLEAFMSHLSAHLRWGCAAHRLLATCRIRVHGSGITIIIAEHNIVHHRCCLKTAPHSFILARVRCSSTTTHLPQVREKNPFTMDNFQIIYATQRIDYRLTGFLGAHLPAVNQIAWMCDSRQVQWNRFWHIITIMRRTTSTYLYVSHYIYLVVRYTQVHIIILYHVVLETRGKMHRNIIFFSGF